jgi:hypothetical protein
MRGLGVLTRTYRRPLLTALKLLAVRDKAAL